MKTKITLLITLMILSFSAKCQYFNLKEDKYWLNSGIGIYNRISEWDGFTLKNNFNYVTKNNTVFRIQTITSEELAFFQESEKFKEFSLMIGKGYYRKYFQIQGSIGLGYMYGIRSEKTTEQINYPYGDSKVYTYTNMRKFQTIGIPLGVDVNLVPIKYLGIGFSLGSSLGNNCNINYFTFNLSLGKLR